MINCPKCNSYSISGPRYVKSCYGSETLRYSCNQCGYSADRPCADAKDGVGEVLLNLRNICRRGMSDQIEDGDSK